mmetsp:Transcript_17332/g.32287  ORF Transcript_17332/g.32287 Transcript_17332/m.32287 type:complete len:108 (-) Transcript_17332:7-330(-)
MQTRMVGAEGVHQVPPSSDQMKAAEMVLVTPNVVLGEEKRRLSCHRGSRSTGRKEQWRGGLERAASALYSRSAQDFGLGQWVGSNRAPCLLIFLSLALLGPLEIFCT